jgi:hypothetical protein
MVRLKGSVCAHHVQLLLSRGLIVYAGTLADHTGHQILGEVLGGLSHALSSISSDTRKLMQKRAQTWTEPKGVAILPYKFKPAFDMSVDYIAKTEDGIFFIVQDEHENENFLFRPYYMGTQGHDDDFNEFTAILKGAGFYVKDLKF